MPARVRRIFAPRGANHRLRDVSEEGHLLICRAGHERGFGVLRDGEIHGWWGGEDVGLFVGGGGRA